MKYSSRFYLFPIWINAKMNVYTIRCRVGRPFSFFSLDETQQIASPPLVLLLVNVPCRSFSTWREASFEYNEYAVGRARARAFESYYICIKRA